MMWSDRFGQLRAEVKKRKEKRGSRIEREWCQDGLEGVDVALSYKYCFQFLLENADSS